MTKDFSEGGCMCGEVRFRVAGEPESVPYCHCGDCRLWSGAPVSLFAAYPAERVEKLGGSATIYQSSPGVRRSFCGRCGTSLSYEDERLPGEVYLAAGAFDEPDRFRPTGHSWSSRGYAGMEISDDLPRRDESVRPR